MLSDAIAAYHDLLAAGSLAADSQAVLDRGQELRGLFYGKRPVCTVLRPRFLSPAQYRLLTDRVKVLAPAFGVADRRAMEDPAFREQFRLRDWEQSLLPHNCGFRDPSPTSRFDSFFASDTELKFTELNSETPAGGAYSDALAELFYALPVFQEFGRRFQAWAVPVKPGVLHALLDSYRQWRGHSGEPPRVAILDWREVPTFSEFVLWYDYLQAMGVEARIIDPRDVEYTDGKLMAGDYHITLVYKRVLINELVERGGPDHPVLRAARDGAVCMVNSLRCKILFKKASFAVVSDERNAAMFTPEQQRAIADHIPWTRLVEERHTTFHGEDIDLIPFMLGNKDRLVLKPNDEYGGRGIVLGWTVDNAAWERAVALAVAEPHVVQERVTTPEEPFPGIVDGCLQVRDRLLDTNPFVLFGSYVHGCLTRISTEPLVSVTSGGGSTVPTFLVEPR